MEFKMLTICHSETSVIGCDGICEVPRNLHGVSCEEVVDDLIAIEFGLCIGDGCFSHIDSQRSSITFVFLEARIINRGSNITLSISDISSKSGNIARQSHRGIYIADARCVILNITINAHVWRHCLLTGELHVDRLEHRRETIVVG